MEPTDNFYGPALPPHLLKKDEKQRPSSIIGPALPANFKPSSHAQILESVASESSDDDTIGPLPADSDRISKAQLELEERALEYQIRGIPSAGSSKAQEGGREEWMIELPEVKTVNDLGLGARQFKTKEGPDFSDRTSWTNTPNTVKVPSKPSEVSIQQRMQNIQERERDKAMEKIKRKHEKKHKRDKSLLELHEKKLKKKEKVSSIT